MAEEAYFGARMPFSCVSGARRVEIGKGGQSPFSARHLPEEKGDAETNALTRSVVGHMVDASSRLSKHALSYDRLGRATDHTFGSDNAGNRRRMRWQYSYDDSNAGRLTAIDCPEGGIGIALAWLGEELDLSLRHLVLLEQQFRRQRFGSAERPGSPMQVSRSLFVE